MLKISICVENQVKNVYVNYVYVNYVNYVQKILENPRLVCKGVIPEYGVS